jgi:hypothetical protein
MQSKMRRGQNRGQPEGSYPLMLSLSEAKRMRRLPAGSPSEAGRRGLHPSPRTATIGLKPLLWTVTNWKRHTNKRVTTIASGCYTVRCSSEIVSLCKGAIKIMARAKLKLAFCIGVTILLVGCATTVVRSNHDAGDNLSPDEIFKNAQEKYASLTSYSDEGEIINTLNGTTITITFTIRLARPNLYRIEWQQPEIPKLTKGVVWSAGEGDFMMLEEGDAQKQENRETALGSAGGLSGGASVTIPWPFFKLDWGDQFGLTVLNKKRQTDEKVGDVDCYVFASELKGRTRTFWIGKQDFLIHQVRDVISAEAMKAALAKAAKSDHEIITQLPQSETQGFTSTEIHTNIVVNPMLSAADFAH